MVINLENLCSVKRKHFDEIFNEYFKTEDITSHVNCDKSKLYSNYEVIKIHLNNPDDIDNFLFRIFEHVITFSGENYGSNSDDEDKYKEALRCLIKYLDNKKEKKLSELKDGNDEDLNSLTQLRELGEIILFFLTEGLLGAPIALSKVKLKTNYQMPVYGSDGIHISNDGTKFIFGESKLTGNLDGGKKQSRLGILKHTKLDFLEQEISVISKNFTSIPPDKWKIISPYSTVKNIENLNYELTCFLGYQDLDYVSYLKGDNNTNYEEKLFNKISDLLEYYGKKETELKGKKITFFLLPFKNIFNLLQKYGFKIRQNNNLSEIIIK